MVVGVSILSMSNRVMFSVNDGIAITVRVFVVAIIKFVGSVLGKVQLQKTSTDRTKLAPTSTNWPNGWDVHQNIVQRHSHDGYLKV